MKKLHYLTIAVLTALALTACGSSAAPTVPDTTAPQAPIMPHTTPPETTAPAEGEFEPVVLVDNENVCVKIVGTEDDPVWGYTLNVYLENKTDKELMFTVDEVSINRFMCDPFWAESVAAGMKSNSTIYWFESSLAENSITDVEEIHFTLRVYDANDFFAEDLVLEKFSIQP